MNEWTCLDMANPLSWQSGDFYDEPYVFQLFIVSLWAVSDKSNEMDEFSFDWIRFSVREGPPGVFS